MNLYEANEARLLFQFVCACRNDKKNEACKLEKALSI